MRIKAEALPLEGKGLSIAGTLPWRLTLVPEDTSANVGFARASADTIALTVRADSFDLAFFEAFLPEETAQDLSGNLAMDARIGGTPDRPRAAGTMDLRGFGVSLPTLGVTYSEGSLAGRLQGETFRIDTLRINTGDKEELIAWGRVVLEPMADPTLDLRARLRDFRISNSDALRTVASGELELRGTAAKPSLTGKMQLGRTEIFVGGPTAAAVEDVTLTPQDLQQLARRFGPAAATSAEETPGLVDRFAMNVDVTFPRRVWFRKTQSPSIDIELSGKINVRQQPGQPMQFFGQVEPVPDRGEMNMYGRTFKVVEGTIALQGPAEATTLDVTAQYQVPTHRRSRRRGGGDQRGGARPPRQPRSRLQRRTVHVGRRHHLLHRHRAAGLRQSAGGPAGRRRRERLAARDRPARGEHRRRRGRGARLRCLPDPAGAGRGLTLTAGRYLSSRVFVSLQQPLRIGASAEQQSAAPPVRASSWSTRCGGGSAVRCAAAACPTGLLLRGRYAF